MSGLPQGFVTAASVLSAIVLNALWQDALLVVSVWALLRLWPRINAATRYVVWSATLVAAFVVPVATTLSSFALPQQPAAVFSAAHPSQARPAVTPAAGDRHYGRSPRAARSSVSAPAGPRVPERLRVTMPAPVALVVFVFWLMLAAYALVRLGIGLVHLERLKRDALPLPVEYRDAMPQWIRANKGARDVRLCVSDDTDVPVAVGLFDAMILVPHTLLDRLSEGEVDQICLHELAHLRRADDWTNGFQRLLIALLGWNPAAHFIGQQLDLEREVACDDWVLSFVGMVRPYALCLTKMAERASWPRHPIPAPGVFATRKHISLRIERLLGAGRNVATNLALAPATAAIAAVAALALVIGLVAPSVAAPCVVQTVVITQAPAVAASTARHAAVPAKEAVRTIVREVRVAVPAAPAPAHASPSRSSVSSVTVPSVTVPSVKVPGVKIPAITVPGVTVPKIVVPKITVPGYDSKQLADNVSKQVQESIKAAIGRPGAAGSGQNCSGCDFGGVNWSGRDMRGVNYTGVDLSGANLTRTNFSGGSFNGVDFSKANLAGASFRNARLTGCDFSGANLSGVDFGGARLSGCQFTGAQLASSGLRDVLNSCTGCDFRRANLSGLDLSNVRANGDDLSGADLRGVNLSGAVLTGIDFGNAKLDGANLNGTTFNGCDLRRADLSHVDLSRAKMIGTDFSNRRSP